MKQLDVSVVMAEYNTPIDNLKIAIQSILDQTYRNFEFIIVDDGGRNNLEEIVATFDDDRIKIVTNPKNMGFVYSLNEGIRHARGKYIARMDTDDISLPTRIEKLHTFLEAHPEYAVAGTKTVEFSGDKELGVWGKPGEKNNTSIMHGDVVVHASALIRKEALEAIGYYKEYKRAEDLALWCELLLSGYRLFTIDEVLYRYRVNIDDYGKRKLKHRKDEIRARLHFYPRLGATPFDYLYILKSIIAGILPNGAVKLYRQLFVMSSK